MHRVAHWIGTTGPGVNLFRDAIAPTSVPTPVRARPHAFWRDTLRSRRCAVAALQRHTHALDATRHRGYGRRQNAQHAYATCYQYAAPVPAKVDARIGAGRRGRVTQRAVIGQRGDDQRATHLRPRVKVSAADATANSTASHAKAMASRACILCRAPTPLTHASSAVRCNVPDGAHAASLATRTGAGPHGPPEARACAGRLGVARRMWVVTTAPPYRTVESWRK